MSTFYEKPGGGAGTHVFAIGVGKYNHLIGGTTVAANPLGLGQLTSPPVSTRAFIEWFLAREIDPNATGFSNHTAPLVSIEALISAPEPVAIATPNGVTEIASATLSNIDEAFGRWLKRVRASDKNIGVFYFCGHGVAVDHQYLLAEDFGQNDNKPWERAFNISMTLLALIREVKGTLYAFIDACREISREKAATLGADPAALKAVDLKKPVVCDSYSFIHATGVGRLAFGTENNISRFTEALLKVMSGYCGIKLPGAANWSIDGEILANAVRRFLENGNRTPSRRQVSDQTISGNSVPLLHQQLPPKVIVELDLTPEAKRTNALIYLKSYKGVDVEHEATNGALRTEVARGFYDFGARAKDEGFPDCHYEDQELQPPVFPYTIVVGEVGP